MQRIRALLHPSDFSDLSQHAFVVACLLARHHQVPLYVLHVSTGLDVVKGEQIGQPRSEQYLAAQWQELEAVKAPDIEIRRALEEGNPAEEIVRFAREKSCDLIVMGTHGRSGLGRLVIGSVAEEVIRRASCPVITVNEAFAAEPAALHGQREKMRE